MVASELKFGFPDVHLTWSCGGTVNPSCFVGHHLFVLFLPTDQEAAVLESYGALVDAFAGAEAWFLVSGRRETFPLLDRSTPIAFDPSHPEITSRLRAALVDIGERAPEAVG